MKVNIKETHYTGILLEFSSANKLGCKVCKIINSRDNDFGKKRSKENVYKTSCCIIALIICIVSKGGKIRNRYTVKYHT